MAKDSQLSDTTLRAIKPTGKAQKLFDGGELFLFIALKGGKLWRLNTRHALALLAITL